MTIIQRRAPGARPNAFTLIELLIVVAIIAILAAIAVPNFLEAQIRSKVSRIKSDIRTLATAVESYRVDHNGYPIPSGEEGELLTRPFAVEWFETRMPLGLTTPVAYMSSIPHDIFGATETAERPLLHYSTRAYVIETENDDEEFRELVSEVLGGGINLEYFILSHGPDKDHDFANAGHSHPAGTAQANDHLDEGHDDDPEPALYDPTNGTVSNGDVVFWGPGIGFHN